MEKKKRPKCYNCRFAGDKFTINGKTHMHCHNEEKYPIKDFDSGKLTAWDTLMEFSFLCDKHEFKSDPLD